MSSGSVLLVTDTISLLDLGTVSDAYWPVSAPTETGQFFWLIGPVGFGVESGRGLIEA